ncbi:hypothetical protein [Geotalea sp. SG265]|uniref:hypothetical protein n=1 Tax=Geotalea sp. SG265 TaxID=2922867 RepID=UPI001FAFEBE3|nr:hypothetical protein [Geotalea sp. SG265]
MGFLRSLLGTKTAGMMACFDIAKPLTKEAVISAGMLLRHSEYFPEEQRVVKLKASAMLFTLYFMHYFNREFFSRYGSQKLSTAQRALFPTVLLEFNKLTEDNISTKFFYDSFYTIENSFVHCNNHGSAKDYDNTSTVIGVFARSLSSAICNDNHLHCDLMVDIAFTTEEAIERIYFEPKITELSRWY